MAGREGPGRSRLGGGARTTSASAGLAWSPTAGWALGARVSWGRTGASSQTSPAIAGLSAPHSRGWSIAVAADDRWRAGDRLSIRLARPLWSRLGSPWFDTVQSLADDGTPQRAPGSLAPVPGGQERRLELVYGRPLDIAGLGGGQVAGWLDLALVLRVQPDLQADSPTESAAMLRWQSAF